ncbi:MAG: DUF6629 family protein [Crocinitomicaceae bacterium]
MCFSATASFSAGVVLTVIGVASIKKTNHKSQLMFASIPLIFGVQQLAEGLLWISLPNPDLINTHKFAAIIYLIFAQIVWPIWVPIAILKLEKSATRKTIQRIFVGAGILVGSYLAYCLIIFPLEAKIIGHHIAYFQHYPLSIKPFIMVLYASATVVPFLFSHIKRMWIFGVSILISYIVTVIFYEQYTLSVWCFFSSIISISIYLLVEDISKMRKQKLDLIST